nr:hypothetical protein [Tanacetum cinerariifolium]
MATTIDQQVALDEALVPSTKRLRTGRSNFRLPSNIQSKEPTLQVVYDVLRGYPFFKAFLVTADVPAIYMQEFWATAYVHQHSDSKWTAKRTLSIWKHLGRCFISVLGFQANPLMSYRLKKRYWIFFDFLDIVVSSHQTTQQYGAILPIELTTDEIRNSKAYKEYYACASGEAAPKPKASARKKKSESASSTTPPTPTPTTTVESALRLSTTAKGKQPARAITPTEPTDVQRTEAEQLKIALKRIRQETSTIKVVSRHQTTQQYGAILPIKLTTDEIRNSKAYKEYYACAIGEAAPKPKASARKKKGYSAPSTTPPTPPPTTTVESAPRLSATAKGKQPSRVTTPVKPTDAQRTEAEQLKLKMMKTAQLGFLCKATTAGMYSQLKTKGVTRLF